MHLIHQRLATRANLLVAGLFACLLLGGVRNVSAQSPFFPNNNAVYYNPYGQGMYNNNYAQVYGRPFAFGQLPAAYSQALPNANYGYRTSNYPTTPGYGGSMYIRNFGGANQGGGGGYYNPYGN